MALVDESSPHIDIDSIIASKNITDESTLENFVKYSHFQGFQCKRREDGGINLNLYKN